MFENYFKGEFGFERKYARIINSKKMQNLKDKNNDLFILGIKNFLSMSSWLSNQNVRLDSKVKEAMSAFALLSIIGYEENFNISIRFSSDRKIAKEITNPKAELHGLLIANFSLGIIEELQDLLKFKKQLFPEISALSIDDLLLIYQMYLNAKFSYCYSNSLPQEKLDDRNTTPLISCMISENNSKDRGGDFGRILVLS